MTPAEKLPARDLLARALLADYGGRTRIVRINGLDTEWGEGDARAFAGLADAVLVPKVGRAAAHLLHLVCPQLHSDHPLAPNRSPRHGASARRAALNQKHNRSIGTAFWQGRGALAPLTTLSPIMFSPAPSRRGLQEV